MSEKTLSGEKCKVCGKPIELGERSKYTAPLHKWCGDEIEKTIGERNVNSR